MCGIYFLGVNSDCNYSEVVKNFQKIKHRGPDQSVIENFEKDQWKFFIGFHRLAIIGIENGRQPFFIDGIYLICNGEIFNHHEIVKKYNLKLKSNSDCEVIIHLYKLYGEKVVDMLDGDFAFVLFDTNLGEILFARDIIGVRPLFYEKSGNGIQIGSELKSLSSEKGVEVLPGYVYRYNIKKLNLNMRIYKNLSLGSTSFGRIVDESRNNLTFVLAEIKRLFTLSVQKRLESERDIGFLLSGGLDSSLVLSIASDLLPEKQLHAFSIGNLNDTSPDIQNSKTVVNYLNIKYRDKMKGRDKIVHHIVNFDYKKALKSLEEVIYYTETFDITTIRASTPMWILCKYIKENTNIKVLYSGEGSDELFGGYLYFYYSPGDIQFEKETRKLVDELYMYDVCRADRSVSSNGLELRVPFLDKEFVKFVLNISGSIRRPIKDFRMEKWLLRESFKGYLPESILWLQKAAFSDNAGYGWKDMVRKYCEERIKKVDLQLVHKTFSDNPEEIHHRIVFQSIFGKHPGLISHLWLPNKEWVDTGSEPSARVLEVHK